MMNSRYFLTMVLGMLGLTGVASAGQLSDYVTMQIVAHEDDDILFMNPDIQNMIAGGYGSVTVYLTAGQSVGTSDGTQSREYFAASRQEGERAAYAAMAGVDNVPGAWDRSTLLVRGGNVVEVDTLVAAPHITLIFMNLPDGGDDIPDNNLALLRLFENLTPSVPTIVPEGTPITLPYSYTRDALVGSLVDLLNRFHPHVVRSLDPHPIYRGGPLPADTDCRDPVPWDFVSDDNPDHVYAARFANEALELYRGPADCRHVSILHYLGYSIPQHLGNLGEVESTWKSGIVDAYKAWDRNFQQFEACYPSYYGATYYRYPGGTTWVKRQSSGLLSAFAVENSEVVMWSERSAGGPWNGPVSLGGGPASPDVAVAMRPDGRLQVFALRLPGEQGRGPDEIVTAIQVSLGSLSFGPWQSLGTPSASQWTGAPAVAANADGRLQVFIRNFDGGVSTRWELTGGGWSGWLDLGGGPGILDGLAAITSVGGRIELFATTRFGTIARWYQVAPNDVFAFDATFPAPEVAITTAASSPTVTYNQDGRLEVFYREQGSARVRTAYQTAVDGPWSTNLVLLHGDAGIGPVAAVRHDSSGIIMLFERNAWGGVSGTAQIGPNDVFSLQWSDLGGLIPHFPGAAVDGAGRTVLATVGIDGRLYLRRQESSSPISEFGAWAPAGSSCSPGGGRQLPSDANQDGRLDLSDTIWLLGHLFLGANATLPCEGGAARNPGPGELSLLDANGDGRIDISDAVYLLGYLFAGDRPPPALGRECLTVSGCPEVCSG